MMPVHEFAMMMTIALRFVPTLLEETEKIMAAQKARGADMESGGLMQRIKALIPVLIPLFVSAFRRAFDLATAMESRCYHGGEGRTKMKVLHLSKTITSRLSCAFCTLRRSSQRTFCCLPPLCDKIEEKLWNETCC